MNQQKIFQLIAHGEGYRPLPYQDTKGLWTWGIGRCYQTYPLTLRERRKVVESFPMSFSPEIPWSTDQTTMILSQIPASGAQGIAKFMVDDALGEIVPRLAKVMPWWESCDEVRQAVWVDWSYNMGLSTVASFGNTSRLMSEKKYQEIADQCLTWPWAKDVGALPPAKNNPHGGRAWYISQMMSTGKWPSFCF